MKIGFIGAGNMAQAIIKGMIESETFRKEDIIVSAKTQKTLERVKEKYGVITTDKNVEVAKESDYLFLAIKPQYYTEVIKEIRGEVDPNKTAIISIAPGFTLDSLENEKFEKEIRVFRTMPNTPSMVREGMTGICYNKKVSVEDIEVVKTIFEAIGKVEEVPEYLMETVAGVSGSSPAYVYMFIEALADGAVSEGMPRELAYKFASQAVLGAAKMVLESGEHPGMLKDKVCSPGGTTIEAVRILESKGMRNSVIEAVKGCVDKAKKMSKL